MGRTGRKAESMNCPTYEVAGGEAWHYYVLGDIENSPGVEAM